MTVISVLAVVFTKLSKSVPPGDTRHYHSRKVTLQVTLPDTPRESPASPPPCLPNLGCFQVPTREKGSLGVGPAGGRA